MTNQHDGNSADGQQAEVELLATTNWLGGKVSFRCVGVEADDRTGRAVVEALEQLTYGWHLMFIWFIGVLKGRDKIQADLAETVAQDEPVNFGCEFSDGRRYTIRTSINGGEAVASFSDELFGKLYAKSFVLSIFSHWEDTIRPSIVKVLGVQIREAESDVMGEWRFLRNWLEHPTPGGDAERQYFSRAKTLPALLGSQPGKPEVTIGGVFSLMELLKALTITVNPQKQEPIVRFVKPDPETWARIQEQMGPNDRLISW